MSDIFCGHLVIQFYGFMPLFVGIFYIDVSIIAPKSALCHVANHLIENRAMSYVGIASIEL